MTLNPQLMRALDFNAVNCGDRIAAVYFAWAASELRKLERQLRHLEGLHNAERAYRFEAEGDAHELASVLGRIIDGASPTPDQERSNGYR